MLCGQLKVEWMECGLGGVKGMDGGRRERQGRSQAGADYRKPGRGVG